MLGYAEKVKNLDILASYDKSKLYSRGKNADLKQEIKKLSSTNTFVFSTSVRI